MTKKGGKPLLNKGKKLKLTTSAFTLIELLAVIVILAIIAVIATPIILNIINDTKKSAAELSVKNYLKAIEQTIVSLELDNKQIKDGTYDILENGNICLEFQDNECINELKIEFEGRCLTSGIIKIENNKVVNLDSKTE